MSFSYTGFLNIDVSILEKRGFLEQSVGLPTRVVHPVSTSTRRATLSSSDASRSSEKIRRSKSDTPLSVTPTFVLDDALVAVAGFAAGFVLVVTGQVLL